MLGWHHVVAILSLALHAAYAANATLRNPRWPPKPHITNYQCPVQKCRGISKRDVVKFTPTLLQTSSSDKNAEPNEAIEVDWTEPENPHKVFSIDKDSETSIYDVDFKPGHFTCMSCDVGTCAGCDIICDLSQCLGEFYQQECWCRKDRDVKLKKPLWWYREYDSKFLTHDTVYQMFCDDKCTGGICDTKGLMCEKREEGCKPWWWCNLPPPREDNLDPKNGWGDGFSYSSSMVLAQTQSQSQSQSQVLAQMNMKSEKKHKETNNDVASLNARINAMRSKSAQASNKTKVASEGHRLRGIKTSALQMSDDTAMHEGAAHGNEGEPKKRKFEPNDFGKLNFKPGRFTCEAGALPPKVQDPKSFLWVDRGYLVLDRFSCSGSLFNHKCLCWDTFLYQQGKDPMTSAMMCDSTCTWGQCEGRTCGKKAPPPLPPPPPAPPQDPLEYEKQHASELHNVDAIQMDVGSEVDSRALLQ